MSKLQVMVLGCNGQVGRELVYQLGDECVPKTHEVLDITKLKETRALIAHARPSIVVNCAGMTSPTLCERNKAEAWRVNASAVDNLIKSCAISGIPFMQIGCDQVFGADETRYTPYVETDPIGPVNYYGVTKAAAEHSLLRLSQALKQDYSKPGFRYWNIRSSMLYERPWRRGNNWIYQIMSFGSRHRQSEVSLPIDVFRSPTYVPHFVKALIWLMRHHNELVSGIYHVASPGAPSLYDIGFEIATAFEHGITLNRVGRETYAKLHGRQKDSMPQYTALDSSKYLDISPIVIPDWRQGIEEFIEEWKLQDA